MSKNAKIWTAIIIIVVIIGVVWAVYAMTNSGNQAVTQQNNNPFGLGSTTTITSTTTTDTSNAALDQNTNSVDSQINGLGNDSANANLGNGS